MKNIITFSVLFFLFSCSEKPFLYDREKACEINYGSNAISVIVDDSKVLIKNNRIIDRNSVLYLKTADRTYSNLGKYFLESIVPDMISSLKNSDKIYLEWRSNMDEKGRNDFYNTINVKDFKTRFDECVNQQKSHS